MLPPFASLRAFEAVARHLSVTRAAAELRISQPAVSQHLRQLEAHLGVPLLLRGGRQVALTAEGRAYAQSLSRGFAEIRAGTERCLAARRAAVLSVALPSTLAMRWLIPRLAGFHGRHPGIEVRLVTIPLPQAPLPQVAPDAGPPEGVDLEIRAGGGPRPGCRADFLMPDESFPVAAPSLLAARPLHRPTDLAGHTLLSVEAEPRSGDWAAWLRAAGCPGLAGAGRLGFGSSAQALEAACAGLGVAIGHRPFVADDLAAGRLAAPFDLAVPGPGAYWLVSRRGDAELPRVRAFRDWLLAEPGCGAAAPRPESRWGSPAPARAGDRSGATACKQTSPLSFGGGAARIGGGGARRGAPHHRNTVRGRTDMRSFEGQRSDNVVIKRSNKEKELQLRQLREQLAGLKSHATPTLRASMEKKIALLEEELKGDSRPLRRD